MKSGKHGSLPFTRAYIQATTDGVPTEWKYVEAINILEYFEDFYKDRWFNVCYITGKLGEEGLKRAKEKIRKWEMEDATTDIFYAERILNTDLGKELSNIRAPDVKALLFEKMSETYPQFEIYRNMCIAGQNFNPKSSHACETRAVPGIQEASL
jgi:hypothetical protein